jgi:hypothetical protein
MAAMLLPRTASRNRGHGRSRNRRPGQAANGFVGDIPGDIEGLPPVFHELECERMPGVGLVLFA